MSFNLMSSIWGYTVNPISPTRVGKRDLGKKSQMYLNTMKRTKNTFVIILR